MEKSKIRVLVVDDEEGVLQSLKTHLELDGYKVEVSDSASGALEKVRDRAFHIVLADINMPGMDGIELLEEIKKLRGETIVIMITAYSSLMKVVNSRVFGAADYVLKPFRDLAELDLVIERSYQQILRWEKVLGETMKQRKRGKQKAA
jgi:DNA-binding NtrC family response regulator